MLEVFTTESGIQVYSGNGLDDRVVGKQWRVYRRRNAVALIYYTVVWEGPTVASTLDPDKSREKLGASLPYLLAVERVLVQESREQPVWGRNPAAPGP